MKKNKNQELSGIRKVLLNCLKEGGKMIQRRFGFKHTIRFKSPLSLVTEVDIAVEKKVVSLIHSSFPSHQILTEESPPYQGSSSFRWIIDPVDGTTNYVHHIPLSALSIGVEFKGEMLLGGIYNPMIGEFFWTEKGKGSFLNGKRIRVSKTKCLLESLLVTGFPYDRHNQARFYLKFVEKMLEQSRGIRRLGAAALDLAYVACGRFDAFWEFNLQPWDVAAGVLMVEEAGGLVSNFKGGKFQVNQPRELLSSNGLIHPLAIEVLAPKKR